jgi:hypothetical protein
MSDKPLDHRRALQLLAEAQVFAPAVVPGLGVGGFFVFSAAKELGRGETIDDAMIDARERGNIPDLPPRPAFRIGFDVRTITRNGEIVATCTSRSLAMRIVNALNQYNPNSRGL